MTEIDQKNYVPEKEPMTRAWLLIKLNASVSDKGAVAASIYDELNKKYKKWDNVFVVRVDVVSSPENVESPFDLIAPVYTDDDFEEIGYDHDKLTRLKDIEATILELCSKEVASVQRSVVVQHVPDPSWKTQGYITWQEVNSPVQGPKSHRPW